MPRYVVFVFSYVLILLSLVHSYFHFTSLHFPSVRNYSRAYSSVFSLSLFSYVIIGLSLSFLVAVTIPLIHLLHLLGFASLHPPPLTSYRQAYASIFCHFLYLITIYFSLSFSNTSRHFHLYLLNFLSSHAFDFDFVFFVPFTLIQLPLSHRLPITCPPPSFSSIYSRLLPL